MIDENDQDLVKAAAVAICGTRVRPDKCAAAIVEYEEAWTEMALAAIRAVNHHLRACAERRE